MAVYEVRYAWVGTKLIQAYTRERAEAIMEETYCLPESGGVNPECEELQIDDVFEVGNDDLDADLREDVWLADFLDPAVA